MRYVCPFLGTLMSNAMFAAPVQDLRSALERGDLGDLNPFPFAMMAGNTAGWLIYGYYTRDPFVIASNLPGFLLSIWLNSGVAKLQYWESRQQQKSVERNQLLQRWGADLVPERSDGDGGGQQLRRRQRGPEEEEEEAGLIHDDNKLRESLHFTQQETLFLRVLVFWSCVLVYTSWFYPPTRNPANLVGIIVNINLVAFYAAPLKTIQAVVAEKNSASIHYETMVMNLANTSFWIAYGCARLDPVIVVPNAIGLLLGLAQGALCVVYPRQSSSSAPRLSLHELEEDLRRDNNNPEVVGPAASARGIRMGVVSAKETATSEDAPEVV